MNKQKMLNAAAMAGLLVGTMASHAGTKSKTPEAAPATKAVTGECHGINSCKGKGECGGPGYGCAGNNSCKGQGWLTTTKEECATKKGTFKADSHG